MRSASRFLTRIVLPATVLAASLVCAVQPAAAVPYAAIVLRADTGQPLYAENADAALHPASITKMMTLYLAFEALDSGRLRLADRVEWSRHAFAQRPAKLGLKPGESLSVDEVIRAIAVKSANDAAVALAERIDGSEDMFAARMTRQARALGMTHSLFVNASGLTDPANVASARDIATLSLALIRRFPRYYGYFSTASIDFGRRHFTNHNHLLGRVYGVDGIKTGFTDDAGWTLAASAERGGRRLIAVVLGARSARTRDSDVAQLIELGFAAIGSQSTNPYFSVAANFRPLGVSPAFMAAPPATAEGDEDSEMNAPRSKAAKTKAHHPRRR